MGVGAAGTDASSEVETVRSRLNRGKQMSDSAASAHIQVKHTIGRMKRETASLSKAMTACDKYRASLEQTVSLASAFHRALSDLTGVLTVNVPNVKEQTAKIRAFTELLKDDNMAMMQVSDCVKNEFAFPLARCAEEWKNDNAALEAHVTRYTKDGQKESKRVTSLCEKLRKSVDRAVVSGPSTPRAIKAVQKLSTAMTDHDRHFSSYVDQLNAFSEASLAAEASRFETILRSSNALAKSLHRQAGKRIRFGEWLGVESVGASSAQFATKKPTGDSYVVVSGEEAETSQTVFKLRDESRLTESSTDEYVVVTPEGEDDDDAPTVVAQKESWKPAFAATDRTRTADSGVESESSGAGPSEAVASKLASLVAAEKKAHDQQPNKVQAVPPVKAERRKSAPPEPAVRQKTETSTDEPDLEMEEAQDTGDAMVITPYTARMADELTLVPGQAIRVLDQADDGWVLGRNVTSLEQGWFHGSFIQQNSDAVFCHALRDFKAEGAATALPLTKGERLRVLNKGPTWWLVVRDGDPWDSAVGYAPAQFVRVIVPRVRRRESQPSNDAKSEEAASKGESSQSPTSPSVPGRPKRDAKRRSGKREDDIVPIEWVDESRHSIHSTPPGSGDESFRAASAAEHDTPSLPEDAEQEPEISELPEQWERQLEQEREAEPEVNPRPRLSSLRRHRFDGTAVDTLTPPGSVKSVPTHDVGGVAVAPPPGFG